MNRPLPLVLGLFLTFGLGCALGGKDGAGKDGVDQDPACADYLDCLTAIDPSSVGVALETYGEDGSCWTSESAAEACATACAEAISAAHQAAPEEPACDDGSALSSLGLLGAGVTWVFEFEDMETGCEYEIGLVDLSMIITGTESPTFAMEGEVEAYSLLGGLGEYPAELTCTLDGQGFTCEPAVFEELDLDGAIYQNILEFGGTFGSTYETGDFTAFVVMEHVGSPICDATTTLTGTKR